MKPLAEGVCSMLKSKAVVLGFLLSTALLGGVAWAQAVGVRSTLILQASTTPSGQPLEFPVFRNQFTTSLVEIAPGGQVGRHMHPVPVMVYILEGELTVETDGQQPRTYKAGQAALEVVNTWHNGLNRGSAPLKFLAVFAGEEGKPVTIRP